ncbi:hypothetical protein PR048_012623 [Dryococelus australis]|uniref:Uncharacterized protein n=1 Tax=Dryococelus australis TaxID=614101 RepID=A0ABQ9HPW1_9NEOP|nr:hypothetical protein PR048_012623 [Dryococelus australis]
MLERFNVEECKTCPMPMEERIKVRETDAVLVVQFRELAGSLIYIFKISRPDITFTTSYLSRFLDHPTCPVWNAEKNVLRYLNGTMNSKLIYKTRPEEYDKVIGYAEADWGGDRTDHKSMSRMASFNCSNLLSWGSKKLQAVALSSAETEYIAGSLAATELL